MGLNLLPAAPGRCVHCATFHGKNDPHNLRSIFYEMRFKLIHDRWPTHADCVAHLAAARQSAYRRILPEFGQEWTEPGDDEPICEPYAAAG